MQINLDELFNNETDEEILKEIKKRKLAEVERKIRKEKDDDAVIAGAEDFLSKIGTYIDEVKKAEDFEKAKKREAVTGDDEKDDDEEDNENVEAEESLTDVEDDCWYNEIDRGV